MYDDSSKFIISFLSYRVTILIHTAWQSGIQTLGQDKNQMPIFARGLWPKRKPPKSHFHQLIKRCISEYDK